MSEAIDLRDPALYINRELSLLEFNHRVLAQARDPDVPLLERLRFLCISCSNLDEFFEVRVASVRSPFTKAGPDGLTISEALARIREATLKLVEAQYAYWNRELIPALAEAGIRFRARDRWTTRQRRWLQRHFTDEILPVLSPLGLDPAHPFPRILNKSLNFAVVLHGRDAFGREADMALVRAPRSLPRIIQFPASVATAPHEFVFLSEVLQAFVDQCFPGMQVRGAWQFRVTRNSELSVDEEEVENLARALQGELASRGFARAVRLEIADNCPDTIARFLTSHFELTEAEVYRCPGPVNLNRLITLPDMVDRPELKFPPFTPREHLAPPGGLFEAVQRRDILLHHPFDSFATVVDFLREAVQDPNVLAIKQTLYRTGGQSSMVPLLIEAAQRGKDVTVVVELRARFDEEANIELANRLQMAGAQVVYGVVGFKTHAKMMLVVRREGARLRRYVHLGTGNYHAGTAKLYTDIGLITCEPDICEDVHKLFQQLSGLGPVIRLKRLLQSPFTLHPQLLAKIENEIAQARAGREARIQAKMNALTEAGVIQALYRASQAGVQIDLIVRGTCALRPGLPGVSDNIRVRSVVGRFLEHSRVYWFHNGGQPELYCSSADWMERNLFRRVEVCFPVLDPELSARVYEEEIVNYLADNTQAWVLASDGSYSRVDPAGQMPHSAQQALLARLCPP